MSEEARLLALAGLAASVTAGQAGNAAWLYTTERKARIAAQLAIITGADDVASGGTRQIATHARNTALDLAETTLLRTRFHYCAASCDADRTPELARIGFQPRRDPGNGGGGTPPDRGPGVPTLSSSIDSAVITLTMTAENATLFNVYQQAPGESEFLLIGSAVASCWTVEVSLDSGEWSYQVAGLSEDEVTKGPRSATTSQEA